MVALVLFGAGASYGSGDVAPYPPPLGNGARGLFARLEEYSSLARELPDPLKQKFRDNFEQGMAEYYEYVDGDVMAFQRDLAQYLAQFTPGQRNEFKSLLHDVPISRLVFATLNYDLLFELSAASMGLNTCYGLDTYPQHVRLLKPHGSCNFWPNIPVGIFSGAKFSRNGRGDVSAPVRPLDQHQTLQRCIEDDSFAPAIAMYAEGKPVRVCPEYVEEQQHYLKQAVSNAKHIFISGVRVHMSDAHIWGDALSKAEGNVTYFGLEGDRDAFFSWKEASRKRNAYFIEGDFSHARRSIASRLGGT